MLSDRPRRLARVEYGCAERILGGYSPEIGCSVASPSTGVALEKNRGWFCARRRCVRVVDARSVDDFTTGHLRGSVNVGFDGRFAETRGMVANIGDRIALITYPGEEQGAALRLARVGSDNAVGYLTVDRDGVFPAELGDLVRTAPRNQCRRAGRSACSSRHCARRP